MEIDFKEQFESYTNAQLMLILNRQEQYEPEAISVAHRLLAGRTVTEADNLALAALLNPSPRKRAKGELSLAHCIIIGVLILTAVLSVCTTIMVLQMALPQHSSLSLELVLWMICQIYGWIAFVLFLRKKKAGWIMVFPLFILPVPGLIAYGISLLISYGVNDLQMEDVIAYAIYILFFVWLGRLMLKRSIRDVFGINRQATIYSISLAVGICVTVFLCLLIVI